MPGSSVSPGEKGVSKMLSARSLAWACLEAHSSPGLPGTAMAPPPAPHSHSSRPTPGSSYACTKDNAELTPKVARARKGLRHSSGQTKLSLLRPVKTN